MPRRDEGFFSARDNTRLYWQSLIPDEVPEAWVGIVHGYGDHSGRYKHVAEHLVAQGLGTIALDYRGHGKADGRRGHCDNWFDFVDDIEVFWARLRGMAQGKPAFVLAHSHGALVAAHWVLRRKPEGLRGLVMTAPYFKMAFDPPGAKVFFSKAVGMVIPWLRVPWGLTPQMMTRDLEMQKMTAEDPLNPNTATPRWFVQSLAAMEQARARAKELDVPLLVAAGGADPIASTPAARAFFEAAGAADKTYKEYPEFLHEILNEVGRDQVLADISRWISQHR
jgi:lysophospholipase